MNQPVPEANRVSLHNRLDQLNDYLWKIRNVMSGISHNVCYEGSGEEAGQAASPIDTSSLQAKVDTSFAIVGQIQGELDWIEKHIGQPEGKAVPQKTATRLG